MTTNLFVIANVKQLRTGGSFRILLPFFRTSRGVCVLNSAIFNSFHNRVEFGTILERLRNFGGGWVFEHPKPSLNTPLVSCHFFYPHYVCYKRKPRSVEDKQRISGTKFPTFFYCGAWRLYKYQLLWKGGWAVEFCSSLLNVSTKTKPSWKLTVVEIITTHTYFKESGNSLPSLEEDPILIQTITGILLHPHF